MKKFKVLSLSSVILSATAFAGCASISTVQTAGVVPQGEIRWAIASTGTGGEGDTKPSADPNFEAAVRYGVAENLDIGLKINFLGAQAGVKYQFMRGDFDLALGFEAGYQWVRTSGTDNPSTHVIELHLPLLMEYHFNPHIGFAFGPKLLGIYIPKTDDRQDIWKNSGLYVGLMIGLPLRLTEGVWFQPEFNLYTNAYDEAKNSFSTALWTAGVAVFFGGL